MQDWNRFFGPMLPVWVAMAVLALAVIAFAMRAERRSFAARNLARPWLWLRLWSIPIALATAAVVIVPARLVGGPEALAAFYLGLLVIGPLAYFGLHWLVARLMLRELSAADSGRIAGSGLLYVIGTALFFSMASPWMFQIAHWLKLQRRAMATLAPQPHVVQAAQRLDLPGAGEVWVEQWKLSAAVRVEAIELLTGEQAIPVDGPGSANLCSDGEGYRLLWPASRPAPRWRMHWSDAQGRSWRSEWTSVAPAGPAQAFRVAWGDDGIVLSSPLPRSIVSLGRPGPNGVSFDSAATAVPAGGAFTDCLPREFRDVRREGAAGISEISVGLWHIESQQLRRAIFRRDAAPEPSASAPAAAAGPESATKGGKP